MQLSNLEMELFPDCVPSQVLISHNNVDKEGDDVVEEEGEEIEGGISNEISSKNRKSLSRQMKEIEDSATDSPGQGRRSRRARKTNISYADELLDFDDEVQQTKKTRKRVNTKNRKISRNLKSENSVKTEPNSETPKLNEEKKKSLQVNEMNNERLQMISSSSSVMSKDSDVNVDGSPRPLEDRNFTENSTELCSDGSALGDAPDEAKENAPPSLNEVKVEGSDSMDSLKRKRELEVKNDDDDEVKGGKKNSSTDSPVSKKQKPKVVQSNTLLSYFAKK